MRSSPDEDSTPSEDDDTLVDTLRLSPQENQWLVAWAFESADNEEVTVRIAARERGDGDGDGDGDDDDATDSDDAADDDGRTVYFDMSLTFSNDAEIDAAMADIDPVSLRPEAMSALRAELLRAEHAERLIVGGSAPDTPGMLGSLHAPRSASLGQCWTRADHAGPSRDPVAPVTTACAMTALGAWAGLTPVPASCASW